MINSTLNTIFSNNIYLLDYWLI